MACKEFQTESYTISKEDLTALNAIKDSSIVALSSRLSADLIEGYTPEEVLKNPAKLDSALRAENKLIEPIKNAYNVTLVDIKDTSYVAYTGKDGKAVLYSDAAVVDILLIDMQGNEYYPSSTDIDIETLAAGHYGNNHQTYHIRLRYEYNSINENMIIRFASNGTSEDKDGDKIKLYINQ